MHASWQAAQVETYVLVEEAPLTLAARGRSCALDLRRVDMGLMDGDCACAPWPLSLCD
jgi:hypothetical protein